MTSKAGDIKGNSDVSVVILTRNSARTLEKCIRSVSVQEPREIIAVDMFSTDATLKILHKFGVTVLENPTFSLGYSRNMGVERSKSKYVMFVDSDVELTDACVATLRRELEKSQWVGVHAKLMARERATYWQIAEDDTASLYYNRLGVKKRIGTAAAMFRKDVLLANPFDASFRETGEDADLCYRLVQKNLRMGVSYAIAFHYHRRDFRDFFKQQLGYGLGLARLGLKYRRRRLFFRPLITAFSYTVRSFSSRRTQFIPYYWVGGVSRFLGVLLGIPRAYGSKRENGTP